MNRRNIIPSSSSCCIPRSAHQRRPYVRRRSSRRRGQKWIWHSLTCRRGDMRWRYGGSHAGALHRWPAGTRNGGGEAPLTG
ncbi:Os02g0702450 [Oryza sativa Japonica Group]|uniref:Os02g0702450 protein n=1 Tax=Oryza sativa subsp. japonica TaxID=39947 RepID=Q6YVK5_ORYSJ|nr:hypothetical protein [Oryza sativa Japonica Group]BAD08060.1 hypothetical protein [Oryza sativa Japonica Group]BAH91858.1 Os02g0702450 [Oryza sativa Japonica Group]|eukprot:NP_001173129.1 Os02g0702450 [Oryza sativa Japonica Group]